MPARSPVVVATIRNRLVASGSERWYTTSRTPAMRYSRASDSEPPTAIAAGYQDFADRWNPILDVFDEEGVRFAHEVHPSEIAYD